MRVTTASPADKTNLPSGWSIQSLGNIAEITMGNSPPGDSYNEQKIGVPLINGPVEFSEGAFGETIASKFTTAPTKMCRKGDFLICVRGSTTGRTNIAAFDACIGRGVAAIQANGEQRYVNHFVRTLEKQIYASGNGSTFPSISQQQLCELEVPLPPLPEQKRIADILDKADAIRRKRQEACSLSEEIVKSAFLDTFGDPVNNPHDWPLNPLGDVVAKLTDGEHINPTFTDIGMPMIMAANVLHEGVSFESVKHVSSEDGMRFRRKCGPDRDDLLVVSRGATIGRCSIVDIDIPFCLMGSVILLKPNNDVACATYLKWLFTHHGYYNKLFKTSGSSAQQAIYLTHLRDLDIPIPPIELQRRFTSQVEAVRTVRQKSERALVEATDLFNSLVQRAFKGEL